MRRCGARSWPGCGPPGSPPMTCCCAFRHCRRRPVSRPRSERGGAGGWGTPPPRAGSGCGQCGGRNGGGGVAILEGENPDGYLRVRGRVAEITEAGADAHIDSLAKKYLGQDKYPYRKPGEVRVIYKVTPDRVQTMG